MENPLNCSRGASPDSLERVRDITVMACALPAAATHDWCDRAASCLCGAGPGSASLLLVGTVDPSGGIVAKEGLGIAVGAGPRWMHAATDEQAVRMLRTRAQRLRALGWMPETESPEGDYRALRSGSADWPAETLGRVLGSGFMGSVMAGVYRLGDSPGRVLAAHVAVRGDPDDALAVLRATFPLLGARALTALGHGGGAATNWITRREQAILEQLSVGKSVPEIAQLLGRSPYTIQDHIKTLHRKLNASTRGELIAKALGRSIAPARAAPADRATRASERGGLRSVG